MQTEPRLATFVNDMGLVDVLALKKRGQPRDASIPLVGNVWQHQRQIEDQFVGRHLVLRYQMTLRRKCRSAGY